MSAHIPAVTVIIPTYNRARLVGRSITSVLNQTYTDFELIVVDDGSTDNTTEEVQGFRDERLKCIKCHQNSGSPATPTNTVIKAARAPYIAILDSDDEWLPEKLQKQMAVISTAPPTLGVVYTDAWKLSEDGSREYWRSPRIMPSDGLVYARALDYGLAKIGTWSLLMRRECFDKVGLFDPRLRMYIETELLIRVSKYFLLYHIAEPLVNYYSTEGSLVSSREAMISGRKLILQEFYTDIQRDRRLLGKHFCGIGVLLCGGGRIKEGGPYVMKALRAYPPLVGTLLLLPAKRFLPAFIGICRRIRRWRARMRKTLFQSASS
jgi:glycosyltransferase involved in cell wall biosynthesis